MSVPEDKEMPAKQVRGDIPAESDRGWPPSPRLRSPVGWHLLLLGRDDRVILPSVVSLTPGESEERRLSPHHGRRGAGGRPAVPALQADRRRSSNSMRPRSRGFCSRDRRGGRDAELCGAGLAGRAQSLPFSSRVQGVTGVTPGRTARRADRTRAPRAREEAKTVTEAIYDAGFNSGGRFYEASDQYWA